MPRISRSRQKRRTKALRQKEYDRRLWNLCRSKDKHSSHAEAKQHADRLNGEHGDPFICPFSKPKKTHWHIGHGNRKNDRT